MTKDQRVNFAKLRLAGATSEWAVYWVFAFDGRDVDRVIQDMDDGDDYWKVEECHILDEIMEQALKELQQ
jgi:hypothetical protein